MTDLFSDLLGKNGDFGKKWRFLEVFNKIPWSKNAVSDTNSACFFGKIQQNWEENQTGHENVLSIYHDGGVSPRLTTFPKKGVLKARKTIFRPFRAWLLGGYYKRGLTPPSVVLPSLWGFCLYRYR